MYIYASKSFLARGQPFIYASKSFLARGQPFKGCSIWIERARMANVSCHNLFEDRLKGNYSVKKNKLYRFNNYAKISCMYFNWSTNICTKIVNWRAIVPGSRSVSALRVGI